VSVPPDRRAPSDAPAVLAFLASAGGGVGLTVCYALGGEPRVEGACLLLAFGGLGVGLILVAHRLFDTRPRVEEREVLTAEVSTEEALERDLERVTPITRRRLLTGALVTSVTSLVAAALFPIRSLGPNPGTALLGTPWRAGTRAIGDDGRLIRAAEVPQNGLVTIFPEGQPDSAQGQVVLVRVPTRLIQDRSAEGEAGGLLAFSKICTHAGCPVGLYQASTHQLLCPCHQSAFDVLRNAKPVLGPAARALPRLPISVDAEGYVVATAGFSEPVGPAWWSRP
jgi:ubiquinol-cytochrome c reductase iron-sulfur subunit